MAGYGKATFLEKQDRIKEVYQLVCCGLPKRVIVAYCEEHFQIKRVQASNYIDEALETIKSDFETSKEAAMEKAMAFRGYLKAEAIAAGDLKLAFSIAVDEAKLLGLYVERIRSENYNINLNDLDTLTDDQIRQLASGKDPSEVLGIKGKV